MSTPLQSTTPRRFRFHACLGAGSFGEVYRATALLEGGVTEEVAVKVLHVDRQRQRAAVDRLRDEARMLAVLKHPAILRFQEFTRVEGRLALVTEFVDGVDISAFQDAGQPMPLKAVLEVMAQVASALQSAWSTPSPETGRPLGLIHRDIKPQNIRISRSGEVKLLDFGIARTSELSREAQTWIGQVLCTPGYASPELLCGDPSGQASDVYALGATLYALVAHESFHVARTIPKQRKVALLRNRYTEFFAERMAVLPELPEPLLELLQGMLAYDHAERPTVAEVERVCREVADGLDGPGLDALSLDLPRQDGAPGELCGLTLDASPISVEPTVVPVASLRRAPGGRPGDGMGYSMPVAATPMPAPREPTPPPAPVATPPPAAVAPAPAPGVDWRMWVSAVSIAVLVAVGLYALFTG